MYPTYCLPGPSSEFQTQGHTEDAGLIHSISKEVLVVIVVVVAVIVIININNDMNIRNGSILWRINRSRMYI